MGPRTCISLALSNITYATLPVRDHAVASYWSGASYPLTMVSPQSRTHLSWFFTILALPYQVSFEMSPLQRSCIKFACLFLLSILTLITVYNSVFTDGII